MESDLNIMEEASVNKVEFINEVANRCTLTSYHVEEVFHVSFELIIEQLIHGEQVDIPKWGRFSLKKKKATTYKNLFGEAEKSVNECVYPIFQIANGLKTRVKNGHKYKKTT